MLSIITYIKRINFWIIFRRANVENQHLYSAASGSVRQLVLSVYYRQPLILEKKEQGMVFGLLPRTCFSQHQHQGKSLVEKSFEKVTADLH